MQKLSLEALEVVDLIARKGSYAAAALALGKVPSALSYSVQKLEEQLGVRLFRREGRRSVLTPAGEVLVSRGRQLLEDSAALADDVSRVATGWEPRLRIALDATVERALLWPALASLYQEHPSVEIVLMEQVLGGTWEALFDDRVDIIVGAIENVPDQYTRPRQGIAVKPWLPVEMVFVAAPQHPVCSLPQPLSSSTVEQYRGVVVSDTAQRLGSLSRGSATSNALYVNSMQEKLEAHIANLGVGRVPRFLAQPHIQSGALVELDTVDKTLPERTALAYRAGNRGRALSHLVRALETELEQADTTKR